VGSGAALPSGVRRAFMLVTTAVRLRLAVCSRGKSSITAPPGPGGVAAGGAEAVAGGGEEVVEKAQVSAEVGRVEEVYGEEKAGARSMGWWLIGCSGMVAGMVVLGGVTRLTVRALLQRAQAFNPQPRSLN